MPSDLLPGGGSRDKKFSASSLRVSLRRLESLARRQPIVAVIVTLALIYLVIARPLFSRGPRPFTLAEILDATGAEARNYGDWIAKGGARERLIKDTPPEFVDLAPRKFPPNVERIFIAPKESDRDESIRLSEEGQIKLDDTERRGLLGGENWEWSSGVAGLGEWLGPLDMRKDAPRRNEEDETTTQLYQHYRQNAWLYESEKDEAESIERLADAQGKPEQMAKLPLRDRVGTDERARDEAAKLWTRIYGAQERWEGKSALELQVERLVRREPLVVFSKSTCPYSMRAKQLLNDLSLTPPPFIVEYDVRPDAANLKALLARLTSHSTFPNVIIGGRSIGGSDDLAQLLLDNKLLPMLAAVGVKARAHP